LLKKRRNAAVPRSTKHRRSCDSIAISFPVFFNPSPNSTLDVWRRSVRARFRSVERLLSHTCFPPRRSVFRQNSSRVSFKSRARLRISITRLLSAQKRPSYPINEVSTHRACCVRAFLSSVRLSVAPLSIRFIVDMDTDAAIATLVAGRSMDRTLVKDCFLPTAESLRRMRIELESIFVRF